VMVTTLKTQIRELVRRAREKDRAKTLPWRKSPMGFMSEMPISTTGYSKPSSS
jgi:hypothetical protein